MPVYVNVVKALEDSKVRYNEANKKDVVFLINNGITIDEFSKDNYSSILYSDYYSIANSGIINATKQVIFSLREMNIKSAYYLVRSYNNINAIIQDTNPSVMFIEALWIDPINMKRLCDSYPNIKFYVHIHSEVSFLSSEFTAFSWISEYLNISNLGIVCNSEGIVSDLKALYLENQNKISYLPNCYYIKSKHVQVKSFDKNKRVIKFGCFGALRPLKNQLNQAIACVEYCKGAHKKMEFHMTIGELTNEAYSILNNIRALFKSLGDDFQLVEHPWCDENDFINIVRQMDLCLQVSYSETFNMVTADCIANGIQVIGSREIPFLDPTYITDPKSAYIVSTIRRVSGYKYDVKLRSSLNGLYKYINNSNMMWKLFLRNM